MNARQPKKHSQWNPQWNPLRYWHRLSRRWKMTLVGAGMGAFASSLLPATAAYFALSNGYMTHGSIYVVASILGVASILEVAGIMHLLGIGQERELNATD